MLLRADRISDVAGKLEYTGHNLKADVLQPRLLDAFHGKHICQISVGPGGYHTIALAVSGAVYTWGPSLRVPPPRNGRVCSTGPQVISPSLAVMLV